MNRQIEEWFDGKDYTFYRTTYQKGELIVSPHHPLHRLVFIEEGETAVYSLNSDGNMYPISMSSGFTVLGDMEYAGRGDVIFYVEARSEVKAVYLDLEQERAKLDKDIRFLHHIIQSLTDKILMYERSMTFSPSVEEKLLKELSAERKITNIEALSYRFHCSRRQLIRVLKKLEEEGTILHVRRGLYVINDKNKVQRNHTGEEVC